MMQRHPTSSATRSAILKTSEMSACPRPLPENRRSTASRASKIRGNSYGGRPHIFLWEGVPWHTCRRDSEISNHDEQSPFVDRHIRSEEHTSELQSRLHLVCRLLLEKKKKKLKYMS